jgi:hypothetical protein
MNTLLYQPLKQLGELVASPPGSPTFLSDVPNVSQWTVDSVHQSKYSNFLCYLRLPSKPFGARAKLFYTLLLYLTRRIIVLFRMLPDHLKEMPK